MSVSRRTFLRRTAFAGAIASGYGQATATRVPASSEELAYLSLLDVSRLLHGRTLSPVELTKSVLGRIEELNPRLNAYITVAPELAMAQAQQAEREIARGGWRGPLHGVPIGLKDNIDTAGIRTTGGSRPFTARMPDRDSAVVTLLRNAGAVLVGKHNMVALARGVVGPFGLAKNP